MERLIIEKLFTEDDKAFNRTMVNNALNIKENDIPPLKNCEYDFINKILNDFSKKWKL